MTRQLPPEYNNLADATKRSYQSILNTMDRLIPSWDEMNLADLVEKVMTDKRIKNKHGAIKFISGWFNRVKHYSVEDRQPAIQKMKEFHDAYIEKVGKNINTDNLLPYDEALALVRQAPERKVKLVCLLYMLIPSQRPQDYYRLKILKDEEDPTKEQDNCIHQNRLYLNQFKTRDVFDEKVFNLPDEIIELLPSTTGYVFNNSTLDAYRKQMNRRLKDLFNNKKMTLKQFRNIYASQPVHSFNELRKRAESMNHSVETHLLYRRHIQPETIAEVQDLPTDDSKPSPPKLKVRKRAKIKTKPKLATLAPSEAHEKTETDTNSPELPVPEIEEDNIENPYHDVNMDETSSESFGCLELIKHWCPFLF